MNEQPIQGTDAPTEPPKPVVNFGIAIEMMTNGEVRVRPVEGARQVNEHDIDYLIQHAGRAPKQGE